MNRNIVYILLLLTFFLQKTDCFSQSMSSGSKRFVYEPYLGGEYGIWKDSQKTTANYVISDYGLGGYSVGYVYGIKVFYIMGSSFLLGVDASMAEVTKHYTDDANSTLDDSFQDSKGNRLSVGASLGYFSAKYSFKVSYHFINKLTMQGAHQSSFSNPEYNGSAIVATFSYVMWSHCNLNLDYKLNTFEKMTRSGKEISLPGTIGSTEYGSFENNIYSFYLSFPF